MECQWIAIYKNSDVLKQFNPDGSENLFKDINQAELKEFALVTPGKNLSVFPESGRFGIFSISGSDVSETKVAVTFEFDTIKIADEYRLVYFKRSRKQLGQGNNAVRDTEIFNVGLQATIDGNNHVRMLSYDNGNITIIDKK